MITIANWPNWNAIRAEYIGGGISQRKLAVKYGVPIDTLLKRANRENWKGDRDEASNKAAIKSQQVTAATVSTVAGTAARIKLKLLNRLEKEIDALPELIGTESRQGVIEKTRDKDGGKSKEAVKAYKLRDLTAAYCDLTQDLQPTETAVNPLLQSLLELERRAEG